MIKNGFLQQNAFDEVDVYSVPEKQILLLDLIMDFYKRALELIKNGAPLIRIKTLSVCDEIVRLKSLVPNDRLDMIRDCEAHMELQFGELEHVYRGL
jgi:V/A-type H+-transporting ATPase subunit A